MAGFVPNAWLARLQEATVGKTAVTASTVYLGLATVLPSDSASTTLTNMQELTTPGYARIAVPAFNAASLVTPVQITTPTTFSFAALSADMAVPANFAFLADVLSGTAGLVRYVFELAEPILAKSGVPITIPASTLILE